MKRTKDEDKDEFASATNNLNSSTGSNSNDAAATVGTVSASTAVRTTGRVKKPKQVYDPSDNYISRGSRNSTPANSNVQASPLPASAVVSPVPVTPPAAVAVPNPKTELSATSALQDLESGQPLRQFDICEKCGKMELKRGSGHKSNYLACKSCQHKWHFSCLTITFDILAVARKKYKCASCRHCRICGIKGTDLAICSVCVYSFHRNCHDPPLDGSDLSERQWKCHGCEFGRNNNNDHSASEQSRRKSYPGRKKRAQSDPAGQEKSPPVKQGKTAQESKERLKTEDGVAATVATEPSTKNDDPKEQEKGEPNIKKEKIEYEKKRMSMEENEESKEALTVEGTNKKPKEEVVLKPDEDLPEKLEEKGLEKKPEEGGQQEKPKEESPMPLERMDQEPLEEAAVPTASDEDEVAPVSTQAAPETLKDAGPKMGDNQSPVSTWTVEQVVKYLARFYPDEAEAFKQQDVDGASLLLLTREDVINGFGFKLGPALRVFQIILGLQSHTNNVALGWSST
ncbi:histone-lysine N-methyltransferase 2D [Drosophila pseudoobscura]|uniref:Histone-lysine N-methyltransferase 2D n=1 Tax=Drosophila pseudoobscura pseudoobscura TaxID=46245 RepID=A0A6I8UFF9_DROPS|nr:histone-lysine N-methyltransferase 2D [Drosophila pseudoobscura]